MKRSPAQSVDSEVPTIPDDLPAWEIHPTSHSSENAEVLSTNKEVTDFLRIIPNNLTAKQAFHDLAVQKIKNGLNEHHAQHIVIGPKALASAGEGYDSGVSGETTNESSDGRGREEEIYQGYFRLNFECLPFTKGTKWVLGKGSSKTGPARNVDILRAAPGSKSRKNVAAAHAFLRMHLGSGVWMLSAGLQCSNTDMDARIFDNPSGFGQCQHNPPVLCDGQSLKHGASYCLRRARTYLVLGGMFFAIEFCISTSSEELLYLREREHFWTGRALSPLTTTISGIPFDSDMITPYAVFRHGLGSGTFGTVFEGFDPTNGDLRAIKKIVIRTADDAAKADEEIEVGTRLSRFPGIVKLYGRWNSEQGDNSRGRYPLEVFLIQEKGISFKDFAWQEGLKDWYIREELCRQLLEGIHRIHDQGWIHRDITPMNVLYFPGEPKHAALCDFGKVCRSRTHHDTALAGWYWLPPEMKEHSHCTYNQRIDIWLLGYTLLYSWFPSLIRGKSLRDWGDYTSIMDELEGPDQPRISALLRRMLSWEPSQRPCAIDALAHSSLKSRNVVSHRA